MKRFLKYTLITLLALPLLAAASCILRILLSDNSS